MADDRVAVMMPDGPFVIAQVKEIAVAASGAVRNINLKLYPVMFIGVVPSVSVNVKIAVSPRTSDSSGQSLPGVGMARY